ncbi:hypothetical protein DXG01_016224 [Tephrocybe rancida]|nr:hypothetical protein DXG01_016224 [Tephrocybe rancida]
MPPRKTAASSSSKSTTPAGAVNKRTRSNSSSDNEGPSLPAGKKARKGKGKAPEDENDDDAAAVIPKGTTKMVTVIKRGLAPVDPRSGFVGKVSLSVLNSRDSHLVYSNKAEVWDAILNQTDLSGHENKNKFYVLQILHPANDKSKCVLFTRWGRVGANGQSSFGGPYSPTVAVKEFKTLFMAKTGVTWARRFGMVPKKERTYGDEDVPQDVEGSQNTEPVPESKLEPEIKDLCNLMFSTSLLDAHLTALNYDAKKLPLGVLPFCPPRPKLTPVTGQLGKTTVIDAYAVLQLLDEVIKEPKGERARSYKGFRTACENLSSAYYTYVLPTPSSVQAELTLRRRLIPHDFGRRRPTIINNATLLRKELDLLDALKDMETVTKLSISANPVDEAGNRLNPLDANLRSIGLSGLELVANDSAEFAALQAYARYDEQNDVSLVNAFRVERCLALNDASGLVKRTLGMREGTETSKGLNASYFGMERVRHVLPPERWDISPAALRCRSKALPRFRRMGRPRGPSHSSAEALITSIGMEFPSAM